MRTIKYIILHHSAINYKANKDDINGTLIRRLSMIECRRNRKRNFQTTSAIITLLLDTQEKYLTANQ